jgi:hypothetical protein
MFHGLAHAAYKQSGSVTTQTLHSRYNPVKEAEKYVNSLVLREELRFLILIEPGRGYMIPLLQQRFPKAKLLALHVQEQEPQTELALPQSPEIAPVSWIQGNTISLEQFLEHEIPDTEAAAIQIIEWRPALAVYGEAYLRLFSKTVDFIKRIDANIRTIRQFGRTWFKNFFKNIGLIQTVITHTGTLTTLPWIITGAGPSLEQSIPVIKQLKQQYPLAVLAVSSSVQALVTQDLIPELIITTDGGGWALLHMYEALRKKNANAPFGFAASLFAALPSQCADMPLLAISDGSLWQNLVLQTLGIPFLNLVQRGTVTASAVDLAFAFTTGNVFITGTDLAHQDIRTHVRPYSFDRLFEEKASRFCPVYTQTFARSRALTEGGSHSIYAAWFDKQLTAYPKRFYSLGNNNSVFKDLPSWDTAHWNTEHRGAGNCVLETKEIPLSAHAVCKGLEILTQALRDPQQSVPLVKDLGSLLFPGETDITAGILQDTINTLIIPLCRRQDG